MNFLQRKNEQNWAKIFSARLRGYNTYTCKRDGFSFASILGIRLENFAPVLLASKTAAKFFSFLEFYGGRGFFGCCVYFVTGGWRSPILGNVHRKYEKKSKQKCKIFEKIEAKFCSVLLFLALPLVQFSQQNRSKILPCFFHFSGSPAYGFRQNSVRFCYFYRKKVNQKNEKSRAKFCSVLQISRFI